MSRHVLYLQGASNLLNPTLDKSFIEAAYQDDAESARAEWGGEFRQDVSAYLTDDIIDRALCSGERSRPRLPEFEYCGFVDAAGGVAGGDSMTCAIAHQAAGGRLFVDQLVAIDPPFETEDAVARCALALKAFGIVSVKADKYAGLWPAQSFLKHGISLVPSELDKSAIYRETAPLFISGLVSLVDDVRLEVELRQLERTPRSGGRGDAIDHPPGRGSHDDRINAVSGALIAASKRPWAGRSAESAGHNGLHRSGTNYDPWERDQDRSRQRDEPLKDGWGRVVVNL